MVNTILPLTLKGALVKKRDKIILGSIDLKIENPGCTMIMGPNGSGKTTLLRLMHGLERSHKGHVRWNCEDAQARAQQAFVFQTPVLLRRSVLGNIVYALRLSGYDKQAIVKIAQKWLDRVGLSEMSDLKASFLSGGEQQKLALARALACNPQLIFLDEPTANLDGTSTREIESILSDALEEGVGIIMTTHDIGQAKRLGDEVMFLYRGKLHERSRAETFFSSPQTHEAQKFLIGEIVE